MQTQHVDDTQQQMYELPNSPTLPNEPYYQQPAQTHNDRYRMGLLLLVIGLIWFTIEVGGMGFLFGGGPTDTHLYLPAAPSQIELALGAGNVDIVVGESDEFEITADYRGNWRGEVLRYSESSDSLTVNNDARLPFFGICFGSCELKYHVSLPADSQLVLHTTSGDIVVNGSLDNPEIVSTSGNIRLEDAEHGARLSSMSGNIVLEQVAGTVALKTISGDIDLSDGRITDSHVESTSGEIELYGVVGELQVSTTSGDIKVKGIEQGQVDLRSISGEVCAEGEFAGTSVLESTSGKIELRLAEGSNITINAETLSGDIDAPDLDRQQASRRELHGQLGDGSATVNLSTTSGDIDIK